MDSSQRAVVGHLVSNGHGCNLYDKSHGALDGIQCILDPWLYEAGRHALGVRDPVVDNPDGLSAQLLRQLHVLEQPQAYSQANFVKGCLFTNKQSIACSLLQQ